MILCQVEAFTWVVLTDAALYVWVGGLWALLWLPQLWQRQALARHATASNGWRGAQSEWRRLLACLATST